MVETVRALLDNDELMSRMRGFVEETAKLFWTDQGAGVTVNLWPWIIVGFLGVVCKSSYTENIYLGLTLANSFQS